MEIFKIQVPIATNAEDGGMALIYNKSRNKEFFHPIDKDLLTWMDGELKIFVYANFESDGVDSVEFDIDKKAPWQSW